VSEKDRETRKRERERERKKRKKEREARKGRQKKRHSSYCCCCIYERALACVCFDVSQMVDEYATTCLAVQQAKVNMRFAVLKVK
jgi:hypothetical protein